ncbi:MAG: hypothetical protein H6713_20255 [Myxococcales bacterium]|nr:hypothetical protein [Myxococcales bacterium]MCB9752295.1 hypothetical protein [Myxococcales bacterium]
MSVAVVTAGLASPRPVHASVIAEEPDPDALYEEGKAAFEAKDFETATDRWERSYRASGDPLVLYNIGTAYKAWYGKSGKRTHLEKAQVALQELAGVLEEDPTLGDPEEIATMLDEIEKELGGGEEEPVEPDPEPDPEPEGPEPEPEKPPKDKATTLRNAGIGTMAAGGVLIVGGIILGSVFAAKGTALTQDLNTLYEMDAPDAQLETVRADGKTANTISGVGFGLGIVLGGAAIAAGAALFAKSKKLRAEQGDGGDEEARVRVQPTLGGLVLSGRF